MNDTETTPPAAPAASADQRGGKGKPVNWVSGLLLAAILVVVFSLALGSALDDSAIFDEPGHIAAGYFKMRRGDFDFYVEQPPLMNSLSALPLVLKGFKFDGPNDVNYLGVGTRLVYRSGEKAETLLLLARLPTILLFLAMTAYTYWFLRKVTRQRSAALIGASLVGFCPNLMAHGRLATVDMGVTAFAFVASCQYFLFLLKPSRWRLLITALLTGCALASKVSGLILVPFFIIVFLLFWAWKRLPLRTASQYFAEVILLLLLASVVLFSVYFVEMSGSYLLHHYGNADPLTRAYAAANEYARQVRAIYRWSSRPYFYPEFILGQFSFTGWWYYFPVALFLKTPLTTILLGAAALAGITARVLRRPGEFDSMDFIAWASLAFVALFMAAAMKSCLSLGIRYVLPILPFLYLVIALAMYRLGRWVHAKYPDRKSLSCFWGSVLLLVLGSVYSNLKTFPSYIPYFNELTHPIDYDKRLSGSDVDWGQDLRRLARWVEQNHVDRIYFGYFGDPDVDYYLGSKAVRCQPDQTINPGYYAVTRYAFRDSAFYRDLRPAWEDATKDMQLVTIIGNSIYVFRK